MDREKKNERKNEKLEREIEGIKKWEKRNCNALF